MSEETPESRIEKKKAEFISRLPWAVKTQEFEGPLDLLLFLIHEKDLDIFSVNLTSITEGFLEYVRIQQKLDLEVAGEFLVVAALLIQHKTRALLPVEIEETEEEEQDDAELILQRLEEYKKFKEAAGLLREKMDERQLRYTRTKIPGGFDTPDEIAYVDVDVYDLYAAFRKVLSEIGADRPQSVTAPTHTVDEKIAEVELLLRECDGVSLIEYLRGLRSKMEIIVTFLALLECARRGIVRLLQNKASGEIWLFRPRIEAHGEE
jgi:segregation and condensation protein A